jgi:hypothetical protein
MVEDLSLTKVRKIIGKLIFKEHKKPFLTIAFPVLNEGKELLGC